MKTFVKVLCLAAASAAPLFAQLATWTSNNSTKKEQYTGKYNDYDYELWNQEYIGSATMKVTGDDGQGTNAKGGTFEAEWSGTCNVLFRSGKKWGSNSTQSHTDIGNITIDFDATWNSPDDVKYLGVYGWAYFTAANKPNNFSNEIEYYIIQDRGSYKPCNNKQGTTAVIDGIEYGFYVCDRLDQPALSGTKVNFKQFFSIPEKTTDQRRSGKISVSEHFKAWHSRNMYMNGPMYEVAMKVESYKCSYPNGSGSGSAKMTKNILTIGGSAASQSSSSSVASSSSKASSSSIASSSSKASSSSVASSSSGSNPPTACGYQTSFCGGMAFANVTSNTTSVPSTGTCLYIGNFDVIQPALSSTVSINGVENTCGADWDDCPYNTKPSAVDEGYYVYVKTGTINSYQDNGWKDIVAKAKPNCTSFGTPSSSSGAASSSSKASSSSGAVSSSSAGISSSSSNVTTPILDSEFSILNSQSSIQYYTLKGNPLGNKKPSKPGVYIVKEDRSIKKIVVR